MSTVVIDGKEKNVSYILDDTGNDGFDEGDDLNHTTKETLGQYLDSTVKNSSNVFKVSGPLKEAPVFSNDEEGTPPIPAFNALPNYAFLKKAKMPPDARALFDTVDESEFFAGKLGEFFNKSKNSLKAHELLTDIQSIGGYRGPDSLDGTAKYGKKEFEDAGEKPLQKQISAALTLNRFTGGTENRLTATGGPFIRGGGTTRGTISYAQGAFGVYRNTGTPITLDQLRNVGIALTLRATGHPDTGMDTHEMTVEDTMMTNEVQTGQSKVAAVDLFAESILASLGAYGKEGPIPGSKLQAPDTEILDDEETTLYNNESFGQINSPIEPFGGLGAAPQGMTATTAAALGVVMGTARLIGLLLASVRAIYTGDVTNIAAAIIPGAMPTPGDDPDRPNALGEPGTKWWNAPGVYRPHGAMSWFLDMMGIPYLRCDFEWAMSVGQGVFFGSDAEGFALGMMRSPGFYTCVVRNIVKDMGKTSDSINNFDPDGFFGAFGAIDNLLGEIASSSLFRFMMILAGIGDQMATKRYWLFNPYENTINNSNELPDTPSNRVKKSRVNSANPTLAWRATGAASLYLLPASMDQAGNTFRTSNMDPNSILTMGMFYSGLERPRMIEGMEKFFGNMPPNMPPDTPEARETGVKGELSVIKGTPIDVEYVRIIENRLDGEYVPFYFHDLRTNEIISFHAFLTNLGESFAPQWNAQSAFGRIDDVQIYNKTSRTLNVSFVVAATSKEDFDKTWYNINRFVAMIYPQWSAGSLLEDGDGRRFRMPFSQVPTASPVLRMRIGDLIRTNYSRFNLGRLFGIGEAAVISKLTIVEEEPAKLEEKAQLRQSFMGDLTAFLTSLGKQNAYPSPALIKFRNPQKKWIRESKDSKNKAKEDAAATKPPGEADTDDPFFELITTDVIVKVAPQKKKENPKEVYAQPSDDSMGNLDPKLEYRLLFNTPEAKALGTKTLANPDKEYEITHITGDILYQSVAGLIGPSQREAATRAAESNVETNAQDWAMTEGVDLLRGAEDKAPNEIVRSFEATMGRGLAGVITALDFDYNASTWEIEPGSRAPQFMTVTLSFAVIHDITPGLDADGFMRAPTHLVGDIVRRTFGDPHDIPPASPPEKIVLTDEEQAEVDKMREKFFGMKAGESAKMREASKEST